MKVIKLWVDYKCWPLWSADSEYMRKLDPSNFPISDKLNKKLLYWSSLYDSTLNENHPSESGFKSEDDAREFAMLGRELIRELQKELGPEFKIIHDLEEDYSYYMCSNF